MNKFVLVALAAVAAIVLGFGVRGATQTAHADADAVNVVGCEFLIPYIDGDPDDSVVASDITDACYTALDATDITNLANALGDEDGTLEIGELDTLDGYDGNQISDSCTGGREIYCTLHVFVFVDDEAPVIIDPDGSELEIAQDTTSSVYTCSTDLEDGDCDATIPNNGDGVVVFQLTVRGGAGGGQQGDTVPVTVRQENVEQSFDVNIVGDANDISLTLAEDVIMENGSTSAANACVTDSDVTDAIDPPEQTLAIATVLDSDDTELARVPVTISIPAADDPEIATIGDNTSVSLVAGDNLPTAFYAVICGGEGPGETTVTVAIDDAEVNIDSDDDDSADLTVVGEPATINATVSPQEIQCNGTNSSTVTATVLDSDGNNVPAGVPVNFSVVALGTANPINQDTSADGTASSTITPLSNASAGVTVIITAGDAQTSVRVDCAIPLAPTAPAGTPTQTGRIGPPDTGNGGYLGQDGSAGFPAWTLIVLAIGAGVVVTGSVVARSR